MNPCQGIRSFRGLDGGKPPFRAFLSKSFTKTSSVRELFGRGAVPTQGHSWRACAGLFARLMSHGKGLRKDALHCFAWCCRRAGAASQHWPCSSWGSAGRSGAMSRVLQGWSWRRSLQSFAGKASGEGKTLATFHQLRGAAEG